MGLKCLLEISKSSAGQNGSQAPVVRKVNDAIYEKIMNHCSPDSVVLLVL